MRAASSRIAAIVAILGLARVGGGLAAQPAIEPNLTLHGLQGEVLDSASLGQGASIVILWASWSPRSRAIVERVAAISHHWQSHARLLTVDFEEERPAIEAFLGSRTMAAPIFLDPNGAFAKRYGLATLPGLLIVKDGSVLFRGQLPDDPDRVLSAFLK